MFHAICAFRSKGHVVKEIKGGREEEGHEKQVWKSQIECINQISPLTTVLQSYMSHHRTNHY